METKSWESHFTTTVSFTISTTFYLSGLHLLIGFGCMNREFSMENIFSRITQGFNYNTETHPSLSLQT